MGIPFTASVCHVSTGAIKRNFQRLGSPGRLMPVIKSDAYGHGLLETAAALRQAGARHFAVGLVAEGAALREAGFDARIVPLLGCLSAGDWDLAIGRRLTPIIGSWNDLALAAARLGEQPDAVLEVAIKCDTGMARLGFDIGEARAVAVELAKVPALRPVILLSHLACADMPEEDAYTQGQIGLFNKFHAIFHEFFPDIKRSLGNSAGTVKRMEFDILRPGLALYGYNPLPGRDAIGLEPAMAVSTPIIHARRLSPGQSISYGRIFTATEPMRAAVAACGYATGFARGLSGKGSFLVRGRRARQIGRVCMSMSMLDISHIPEAGPGDLAWIMGGPASPSAMPVDAAEIAAALGTIPYEPLCAFGAMNPRVWHEEWPWLDKG